jgi:hypothetical protein
MKKSEVVALAKQCNVNLDLVDDHLILLAQAVEIETIQRCVNICEGIYQKSMREWKDDNNRYNLGYAHGADGCIYAISGKSVIK